MCFLGKKMDNEEFKQFSQRFRDLCIAAHGTNNGKDRDDRDWGYRKICNRLSELKSSYTLKVDSNTKEIGLELIDSQTNAE